MTPARLQQYEARMPHLAFDVRPRSLLQELAATVRELDPANGIATGRIVVQRWWLAALAEETWPDVCAIARAQRKAPPTLDAHVAHLQAEAGKGHLILFGLRVYLAHETDLADCGGEHETPPSLATIPQQGERAGCPPPAAATVPPSP